MSDSYHAYVNVALTLAEPVTDAQLREILLLVTPAYISAARRDRNIPPGARMIMRSPHVMDPEITLVAEITLDLTRDQVQWFISNDGPGVSRSYRKVPWPITIDATPPRTMSSHLRGTTRNGSWTQTPEIVIAELPEILPDVCARIAQFLADEQMLGTCASLSATSRDVRYATLPALYRILVWKSESRELTSLHQPAGWDRENLGEYGATYWARMRAWRRMVNGPGAKFIQ